MPWALACAALLLAQPGQDAHAQMAQALGKPLPVSTVSPGTVTVRVIQGSPDKPLVGADVKLVSPDGGERVARTDGEGRATFTALTPGARYVAKAQEPAEDGSSGAAKEATSDEFTIPKEGGLRLMISTRPWQGASGAPGGGMGPGMMDPRQMSGIPRGDPAMAAGQMTVAAVRGVVTNRIKDHMIHLIGYGADGSIVRMSKKTDAEGRTTYDGLSPRIMAYYAMTTFLRGGKDGQPVVIDRVRSEQVSLPPQVGVRMMLAGLPEDSADAAIEDSQRIGIQAGQLGADEVLARLTFTPQAKIPSTVSLFEIPEGEGVIEPRLVATADIVEPMPADSDATFADAVQQPALAVGTLAVGLVYSGQGTGPIPDAIVELIPVTGQPGAATPAPASALSLRQTTNPEGVAEFTGLTPGNQYRVVLALFGERFESPAVTVPPAGGLRLNATIDVQIVSSADARFPGVAPDKLYFVQADFEGRALRTPPFQTIPGRGVSVSLILHNKPLLSFHINGWLDDAYMGFNGQVAIFNTSAMPWNPGPEGVVIELPKGFKGARVEDEMAELVAVDPDRGLIWRGPLPPGSAQFVAGFSLPVERGKIQFDMDLSLGVFNSSLVLLKTPGMQLMGLPQGVRVFEQKSQTGRDLFVISNINIPENQRMVFSIEGMPQFPATQRYVTWLVGGLVLLLLGWAFVTIMAPRRALATQGASDAESDKSRARKLGRRRDELLDELVALEAKKKQGDMAADAYDRARAKLRKQLETVYADLDRLRDKGQRPAA